MASPARPDSAGTGAARPRRHRRRWWRPARGSAADLRTNISQDRRSASGGARRWTVCQKAGPGPSLQTVRGDSEVGAEFPGCGPGRWRSWCPAHSGPGGSLWWARTRAGSAPSARRSRPLLLPSLTWRSRRNYVRRHPHRIMDTTRPEPGRPVAFRHPARGRIGVVIDARTGCCLISHDRHSVPYRGMTGQYLRAEI